ncbi:hypothetical protein HG263_18265 [Pseudoalteromonas sp. JBTF-M23]|uniref:IgA peptidase M64 n=1 Tax=Pseudoalteromonas caenipelagi TaxID=2726988 RepID=A0A849VLA6_9GAMM|nr:hypothetical protein [Pseudoalteromonas caenipelagi]NOU52471.1 hypothetical protein [Pseudoalteromonas caenipelagi]
MRQVKFFVISCFLLVMMVKSHHQPSLSEQTARHAFLIQNPQVYYLIEDKINLSALPEHIIRALLVLDVAKVKFEWAIRLAKQQRFDESRLYWQKYYLDGMEQQRARLAQAFIQNDAFDELQRLQQMYSLPQKLSVLLESERGTLPQALPRESLAAWRLRIVSDDLQFSGLCKNRVLLVSDHYRGVKRLNKLKKQYLKKPEPEANSYCFTEVFYIGNIMACEGTDGQFARCNAEGLIEQYKDSMDNVDYVIVMTKSGQANVTNGMMTLTLSSDYQVFLHELMHFSGFEDEYAVAPEKARWLCKKEGRYAPNLIVAESPPDEGWYESKTCRNGALTAYKPSKDWSIMQYQELPLSHKYRQLWQNAINSRRYQLPTFFNWKTNQNTATLYESASEI